MDSLKYPIKGVVLEEHDIIKIHEYYKQYSMAEYLNAVYGLKEADAFEGAAFVLGLVENGESTEEEAIDKFLNSIEKKSAPVLEQIKCPICGQELVELHYDHEDDDDAYDYFEFWCDKCKADISISVEKTENTEEEETE